MAVKTECVCVCARNLIAVSHFCEYARSSKNVEDARACPMRRGVDGP